MFPDCLPGNSVSLSLLLAVALACTTATVTADMQAAANTPAMTREQADAMLRELQSIRTVLERIEQQGLAQPGRQTARTSITTLSIERDEPVLGRADAPVTVVEFIDFQCPYCKRFVQSTFAQLRRNYIDTGKVRWVVRDLPMSFHPDARKAGQAAHCAGEEGKYWEMREILFTNSPKLEPVLLPGYAQVIGLDIEAFNACLASERYLADMDKDKVVADAARITGTPSFVIGKTAGDSLTGRIIVGAQAQPVFTAEIERLLVPDEAGH